MERLVYLDRVPDDGVLERIRWQGVDGIELDLTPLDHDQFHTLQQRLAHANIPVRTVHDQRTGTVSLQEHRLFLQQLEQRVEKARQVAADVVSVHPPKAEIKTANTVRDVQEFLEAVDDYAQGVEQHICFELTGFLRDPRLINTGVVRLDDPVIGATVDVSAMRGGVDPLDIIDVLDVDIHKLRVPLTPRELDEEVGHIGRDVMAVAEHLVHPDER